MNDCLSAIRPISERDRETVFQAGADDVFLVDETLSLRIRALIPSGVDHIVEVAFSDNIQCDIDVLAQGGSIATCATSDFKPEILFWPLVFGNTRIHFIGSDDAPPEAQLQATRDLNRALGEGWLGLPVAARFVMDDIAAAHDNLTTDLRSFLDR